MTIWMPGRRVREKIRRHRQKERPEQKEALLLQRRRQKAKARQLRLAPAAWGEAEISKETEAMAAGIFTRNRITRMLFTGVILRTK